MGKLLKQGWKPKRTIILCFWDGEEPGLLGSTEWAETHGDELTKKAVAYINSDGNGRGLLQMEGSHTLEKFINGVARDVEDPETKLSAWKRLQAGSANAGRRAGARTRRGGPGRGAAGSAHRRLGIGLGLHGVSRSLRRA